MDRLALVLKKTFAFAPILMWKVVGTMRKKPVTLDYQFCAVGSCSWFLGRKC